MSHKKIPHIDPLTVSLPAGGVDSHAHLDDPLFDPDREDILARAQSVGLSNLINVFLDPLEFQKRKTLFAMHPEVSFILGVHPCDADKHSEQSLQVLQECFATEHRLKAVGEIGLDYHRPDCPPREVQINLFLRQLELARTLQQPVVIHCREAEADCLDLLENNSFVGYPLLWHCFGGDVTLARRLLNNGWHLSIPGTVTYKANTALREAVAFIPSERLLLETDCPYLAPMPWRGTRNESAYTVFTVRAMAEARNIAPELLWQTCGDNARRFFNL